MRLRRRRRLLIVALASAAWGAIGCASAAAAPCRTCDADRVVGLPALQEAAAARALAERHAPVVYLRNQTGACDKRGTPYAPAPVEFVFGVEEIVLRRHEGGRTTDEGRAIRASDLYGKDDSYFLDFPGNPKQPGCVYERDYLARADGYTPVAYAHIAREEGRSGLALQYWLFYYFNDWNNTHEGDWEMIQLTFDGPTIADALTQEPSGVGYSQHAGGERSAWDDDKLTKEGARPVAFVAAGANANMFEPNIILGRGDNGTGFGCDDARRPSRRVDLEARLVEEPADATSEFAWLAYDGRWGERAPWEFNGPTGPNDKRAWTQPFSWQEDLRPSSITVPTNATIGPNATDFFCEAVWVLSTPFARLVRLPPAAVYAAAGVVLGIGVFGATRTRYLPATSTPLRQRRRFGQMLTAAADVYRRHTLLFFGIGLVFVPAGIIEGALAWIVLRTPFIETVTRFFSASILVEVAIALAIGNVASNLVYWFVHAASTAALARIDEGGSGGLVEDYREVLRALPPVVLPRLGALAIVFALALSVIGIPWAIRNAIRWAFIEEAILIDGVEAGDGRRTSARAVDGRWWRASFSLLALWTLGFLLGPAIGVALLLFSPAPVATVNVVSSAVFAGVTPFVAIAQALLYFDLTAEAASRGGVSST